MGKLLDNAKNMAKEKAKDAAKEALKKAGKAIWDAILPALPYIIIGVIIIIIIIGFIDWDVSVEGNEGTAGMSSATADSMEQFIEYMHQLEGCGKDPVENSEGVMCYTVVSDGYGNPVVGYGVDLNDGNHGKTVKNDGYSTSIGTLIPVDYVDAIEMEELNGALSNVKKLLGEDTPIYRIYAMTSFAYNCHGATNPLTSSEIDAIKNYYSESDDHYGDWTQTNLNHKTYTSAFGQYVNSNGSYSRGLEDRRKSEWCLFQTGYWGWGYQHGTHPTGMDEYCPISRRYSGNPGEYTTLEYITGHGGKATDIAGYFTSGQTGKTFTIFIQHGASFENDQCSGCNNMSGIIVASRIFKYV